MHLVFLFRQPLATPKPSALHRVYTLGPCRLYASQASTTKTPARETEQALSAILEHLDTARPTATCTVVAINVLVPCVNLSAGVSARFL